MAKRGKTARRPSQARKAASARKRAPVGVDLKKQIAKLKRELTEALDRQTATSEVLQVISDRPGELAPVFKSMVENATAMQREVEELIRETLDCYADGAIEQGDLSALSLILEQCHLAVLKRMFAIGATMPDYPRLRAR